jgi:hypothetical protein
VSLVAVEDTLSSTPAGFCLQILPTQMPVLQFRPSAAVAEQLRVIDHLPVVSPRRFREGQ